MPSSILGIPAESMGIIKVSLWSDECVKIENHSGVADLKDECVKIRYKKRILAVNGSKLTIEALDGCNLTIKGKILSIEYLT